MQRRARNYRNLVVVVVAIGAIAIATSLLVHTLWPLAGLLALVPICGGGFVVDAEVLERWSSSVLAAWARCDLDLAGLRAAVRADSHLPPEALEGMLATLPAADDVDAERRTPCATRRAAASVLMSSHARRSEALLLSTGASAVFVVAALGALWLRTWTPLLGLVLLLVRPAAGASLRRKREQASDAMVAACRSKPGFNEAEFERLVDSVR
jgi:hypothetical protein